MSGLKVLENPGEFWVFKWGFLTLTKEWSKVIYIDIYILLHTLVNLPSYLWWITYTVSCDYIMKGLTLYKIVYGCTYYNIISFSGFDQLIGDTDPYMGPYRYLLQVFPIVKKWIDLIKNIVTWSCAWDQLPKDFLLWWNGSIKLYLSLFLFIIISKYHCFCTIWFLSNQNYARNQLYLQ